MTVCPEVVRKLGRRAEKKRLAAPLVSCTRVAAAACCASVRMSTCVCRSFGFMFVGERRKKGSSSPSWVAVVSGAALGGVCKNCTPIACRELLLVLLLLLVFVR